MGWCMSLGSLQSVLSYTPHIWGQRPVICTSWAPRCSLSGVAAAWQLLMAGIFLLPEFPGGLGSLMSVTSLFIDMARSIPVLRDGVYFVSHVAMWTSGTPTHRCRAACSARGPLGTCPGHVLCGDHIVLASAGMFSRGMVVLLLSCCLPQVQGRDGPKHTVTLRLL